MRWHVAVCVLLAACAEDSGRSGGVDAGDVDVDQAAGEDLQVEMCAPHWFDPAAGDACVAPCNRIASLPDDGAEAEYCTSSCDVAADDCPAGNGCVAFTTAEAVCLPCGRFEACAEL